MKKEDRKKLFEKAKKEGLSEEYKAELREHEKQAERIEEHLDSLPSINKTTKLIETYANQYGGDFKPQMKYYLEQVAQSAREEERERIKEKYGHFKYKCCVHSWDGCLRLQKELDYEKCFK